tara:strand:+ start:126 stop:1643 length:1518 start_codon:yes stop_codon:yes gene_type:complete
VYTPTYFERNPINIYVSEAEKDQDTKLGLFLKSKFPMSLSYYNNSTQIPMTSPHLIICPEPLMIDKPEYKFVMPIHTMSFSLVVDIDENISNITSFSGIKGANIMIYPSGGYSSTLCTKVAEFYGAKKIIDYSHDTWENLRDSYIILLLTNHTNGFLKKLSYDYRIKILSWKDKSVEYNFPTLIQTTLDLKEYRLFDIDKIKQGYGFKLCLFANNTFPNDAVYTITKNLIERESSIRLSAAGGSKYIPYHKGARKYFEDKGFINIYSGIEEPACKLLAGKGPCNLKNSKNSKNLQTAKKMYERDFWLEENDNKNIVSVIPFIKDTYEQIDRLDEIEKRDNVSLNTAYPGDENSDEYEDGDDAETMNVRNIHDDLVATTQLGWQCFGDTKYRTKEHCEIDRDIQGNPRTPGVWDRPCTKDEDCPFFNANQNYPNKRGGCDGYGFCEMPIGVKGMGFKKFDSTSNPMCHGGSCEKTGVMASPDYVFPDDRIERIKYQSELKKRNILV